MSEIKSFPNNADEYIGAQDVMRWLHGRTSGVFGADNNARVTPVQGTREVTVSDGLGWLSNAAGDGVVWWNDAEKESGQKLTLELDMADSTLDRIDRIVVTWQTTNYVARPVIEVLKGTASSSPVAPALTNNSTKRQISLAAILMPAGATSIAALNVTDERLNPAVCGIVTESITADTATINAQYTDAVAQLRNAIEQAWRGEIPEGTVSQVYTATIPAAGWQGKAPATNTVNITGILATDAPIVDVIPSDTYATAEAQIEAYGMIYRITTANGSITAYATDTPAVNIPIQIRTVRK